MTSDDVDARIRDHAMRHLERLFDETAWPKSEAQLNLYIDSVARTIGSVQTGELAASRLWACFSGWDGLPNLEFISEAIKWTDGILEPFMRGSGDKVIQRLFYEHATRCIEQDPLISEKFTVFSICLDAILISAVGSYRNRLMDTESAQSEIMRRHGRALMAASKRPA